MLQWMGGSRRKVNASRKSTHNRQKQYFEQRRRRQQAPGLENWVDSRNKHAHCHEDPRSLDILSLTNLAAVAQQDYPPRSNGSEPENISTKKSSAVACPQDLPSAHGISGNLDGSKISSPLSKFASGKSGLSPNKQKEEAQYDVAVLDLLSDEGPRSVSKRKSVLEAHVAFSVEGLGNIGVETPAQSPKLNARGSSSPPKASKRTHSSIKLESILYDLGLELNGMMNDVRMSDTGSPSEILPNPMIILDDVDNTKGTKFIESSMHLDYDDQMSSFVADDKDFYTYMDRKDQQLNAKFGIVYDNFFDKRKYEPALKDEIFFTESYPSFHSKATYSRCDNGFGDPDSLNHRIARNSNKRPDISVPIHLANMKPAFDDSFSFEAMFDSRAWSFQSDGNAENCMSLLSEESCSSTSVRESEQGGGNRKNDSVIAQWRGERSYDLHSQAVNWREDKFNLTDKPSIRSEHKCDMGEFTADTTFYTGLGRSIQKKNLMRTENCKSADKKRSSKASHCSKGYYACQGTLKPECISLFDEGYTSVKATSTPGSHCRTSVQEDTRSFSYKLLSEDNLFDLFPVPKHSPTMDLSPRRSISNIPLNHEPFENFILDNEIIGQSSSSDARLHKTSMHPLGLECHYPNSPYAEDFLKDTEFLDLSRGQKVSKDKEDASRKAHEKPQDDVSIEKKSLSSVNSRPLLDADDKDNCTQRKVSEQTQESYDSRKSKKPSEEVEETPMEVVEVSTQLESCVDNKIDQSDGGSPIPSQVGKKDFRKENSGADVEDVGSKGGNRSDTSYQVMLESYVLQLLCVHKVLMEASEMDIKKKIILWKEGHLVDLVCFGIPRH